MTTLAKLANTPGFRWWVDFARSYSATKEDRMTNDQQEARIASALSARSALVVAGFTMPADHTPGTGAQRTIQLERDLAHVVNNRIGDSDAQGFALAQAQDHLRTYNPFALDGSRSPLEAQCAAKAPIVADDWPRYKSAHHARVGLFNAGYDTGTPSVIGTYLGRALRIEAGLLAILRSEMGNENSGDKLLALSDAEAHLNEYALLTPNAPCREGPAPIWNGNATCPRCGGPAYQGAGAIECLASCREVIEPDHVETMTRQFDNLRPSAERSEPYFAVSGRGFTVEHPIRETAIAMWREKVRGAQCSR